MQLLIFSAYLFQPTLGKNGSELLFVWVLLLHINQGRANIAWVFTLFDNMTGEAISLAALKTYVFAFCQVLLLCQCRTGTTGTAALG
jgi:hypothetical protein